MTEQYVIGIDGGTESIRASVFSLTGHQLSRASQAYGTVFPRPGWAEQTPSDWWRMMGMAVRKAVHDAGINPAAIIGLGVDTTCCSVVLMDAKGVAIRPALIWMDVRASHEADRIANSGDDALILNSNGNGPVSAEWMLPKALWLKTHEPHHFDAAHTICEYQDYLNFHLTGRRCSSINNVSVRWHHRMRHSGAPESLLKTVGLDELMQKWPADILALGEPIGPLQPRAADHLGLPAGIPVCQGGADAFIAMIGLGVVHPGTLALVTGSSHLQLGLSTRELHASGVWGTYSDAVIPGLHVVEGGQTSTGSAVNWFKRMLAADISFPTLDREAAALAPGADGLLALDHFQGNRTPYTDPLSRGAFTGLSLGHSRAHLFRALLESVAMGSRLILESMEQSGFAASDLVLSGGVTNSPLWLKIHADVLGRPLHLTEVADAPALGSAILAACGSGVFGSIDEAASAMVRRKMVIEPDPVCHRDYEDVYERYKVLYHTLKAVRANR